MKTLPCWTESAKPCCSTSGNEASEAVEAPERGMTLEALGGHPLELEVWNMNKGAMQERDQRKGRRE